MLILFNVKFLLYLHVPFQIQDIKGCVVWQIFLNIVIHQVVFLPSMLRFLSVVWLFCLHKACEIFTAIFYSSSKTIQNLVPRVLVTGVYLFLILLTFQEREYLTLVTVTSIPPLTCYGSGLTVDASREEAANSALKALLQSGLDRSSAVKSLEENPGKLHPQRAHMVCKWTTVKLIFFYL